MTQEEIKNHLQPGKEVEAAVEEPTFEEWMSSFEAVPGFNMRKAMEDFRSGSKPVLSAFMDNYAPPERRITPEQARKAKTAAAISDSLSILSELFAHGQGAHVRPKQGASSSQSTNARLRAIEDKYEQDMLRYNAGKTDAAMQDWRDFLRQAMAARGQAEKGMLLRAQRAAKKEADDRQAELEKTKHERNKELIKERAKYRNAGGGGGRKDDFSGVVLNARKDDPNAVTDNLGRSVLPVKMSKQQIAGLANSAKADKVFLKEVPHAYVDYFDPILQKVVSGLTSDANLAWMYAQWLYDKQGAPARISAPDPPADMAPDARMAYNMMRAGGVGNHAPSNPVPSKPQTSSGKLY